MNREAGFPTAPSETSLDDRDLPVQADASDEDREVIKTPRGLWILTMAIVTTRMNELPEDAEVCFSSGDGTLRVLSERGFRVESLGTRVVQVPRRRAVSAISSPGGSGGHP